MTTVSLNANVYIYKLNVYVLLIGSQQYNYLHCIPYLDFMELDQFPLNKLKNANGRTKRDLFEEKDDDADDNAPRNRKKRQAPYLIFPEILCIIDYDGYR